jgi:hypothetical protein
MADISSLSRLLNGVVRNVDLTTNTLVTSSIKVGGLTPTELTKAILDSLIANSHASGSDNQTITAGNALTGGGSGASVTLDVNVDNSTIEINSNALRIKDGAISALKLNATAITGQTAETSADNADMLLIYDDSAASLKKMSRSNFLAGTATDEQVKITASDTTPGYLDGKLVVDIGTNTTNALEKSVVNPGADEDLRIRFDQSKVDHGSIAGLGDDDHTQYHNDSRANTWLGTKSTTDLSEGTNLYFTDERAQDAIGTMVANSTKVSLTYTDGTPELKADIVANSLENADISASAAIAESKLSLDYSTSSLNTAISNHLSDATDAHDASAISSVPAGNLAATDVQSALNELDSEKVAKSGDTMSGNLAMGGNKVTGLGAPTASGDAATKSYVDSVAEGLKPKTAARAATTANITIATDLNSGDVIDGVTLADGDRVLVKDQSTASQNGIYIVGATPARATDFDSTSPIDEINGAMIAVEEGTANAGKVFVQAGALVATVGTDPINFIYFNSSASLVGGDGITVSGSNISVDHDGEGLQFTATQLALELDGSSLSKSSSGIKVAAGGITNTEVNASAAIAYSKLNLSASIVNADVAPGAAIAYSKLALSNSIALGDLASNSVDENKLTASVAGAGLTGGAGSALAVGANADGSITVNANDIQVAFSPKIKNTFVAGESFSANTSYAVRMALTGETAGRVYKADFDATSTDNFYAYGMIEGDGATAKIAGDSVIVVLLGTITLGSSDTAFASGEVGQAAHLKAAGAWDAVSQITYSANQASYRVGIVQETSKILVGNMQLLGIN